MAKNTISAVVNTLNEQKNIERCLRSLSFCDEIVVVDMNSDDDTKKIASKYTKIIFDHKRMGYVEPARNFAIKKATGDYILVIDADEWVPPKLSLKLRELADHNFKGAAKIARDNEIFGGSVRHAGWWPDYNIRFFKAGNVKWGGLIHSVPTVEGDILNLPADPDLALKHHNYPSISSYLLRMDRYTAIQAEELRETKLGLAVFVTKPWGEFLKRYFAHEGYRDGVRGLILSLLQAVSEFVVVAKVWELQKYPKIAVDTQQVENLLAESVREYRWWQIESKIKNSNLVSQIFLKIKRKI